MKAYEKFASQLGVRVGMFYGALRFENMRDRHADQPLELWQRTQDVYYNLKATDNVNTIVQIQHNMLTYKFGWAPLASFYRAATKNYYTYDYHIDKRLSTADDSPANILFQAEYRTAPVRKTINYKSYSIADVGGYLGGLLQVIQTVLRVATQPFIVAMLQSRIIDII